MTDLPMFVCGALAQPVVLAQVLGPGALARQATLPGFALRLGDVGAVLCPDPVGRVAGLLLDPGPAAHLRLMHYACAVGLTNQPVQAVTDKGPCDAMALAHSGEARSEERRGGE